MITHLASLRRLAGVALLSLPLVACGDAEADVAGAPSDAAAPAREAGFTRIVNVEVTTLAPRSFVEEIRLVGTIAAHRDVTVSAEEGGVVEAVLVEKGRSVRVGQEILRLDATLLESQVAEARAQAALAAETWERRRRLWEEDRVGSELAYLEARYAAEQSAARLAALEERLRRTVVRAPIPGVLEERAVEVGALVTPGMPVLRIVQLDPVKVEAGVPERYAGDVSVGTAARITFDALDGVDVEGRVDFVGSAVDPRTRTFLVELEVPNAAGAIKPEMVANVALVRRALDGVIVVPQEAVVRIAEGYRAFVVEGSGDDARARAVDVVPGATRANEVVIEQGLSAGDQLVVIGQQQLADGDRVQVRGGGGR